MPTTTSQQLDAVLQSLRQRIENTRARKDRINEANTKTSFIEPLLKALGWEVGDLDEVLLEYRIRPRDNPVDYALLWLRSPCLFVEAKGLFSDLDDWKLTTQTLNYANTAGVEWCVLTNGDEYRLYNSHALVHADEKLFRKVRISDAPSHDFTRETLELLSKGLMSEKRLNVLWNAYFVDRQVKVRLESLLHEQDPSLIKLLRRRTEGLTSADIRSSLKRADVQIDFPKLSTFAAAPQPRRRTRKDKSTNANKPRRKTPTQVPVSLPDLIDSGLLSAPLQLESMYRKTQLHATVMHDASVVYAGEAYDSLSVSAGRARNAIKGPPSDGRPYFQTNGWTFWKYRDESGKLHEMDHLRRVYLQSHNPNS